MFDTLVESVASPRTRKLLQEYQHLAKVWLALVPLTIIFRCINILQNVIKPHFIFDQKKNPYIGFFCISLELSGTLLIENTISACRLANLSCLSLDIFAPL